MKLKTVRKEIAVEVVVFLFTILFLYAAGTKIKDYDGFVGQMSRSPIIAPYADIMAWLVPVSEIIIVLLLVLPKTRLLGLYCAFAIMVEFTLYITAILFFSEEIPCSCGGVLSRLGWKEHLVFNMFFVTLSVVGILMTSSQSSHQPTPNANEVYA